MRLKIMLLLALVPSGSAEAFIHGSVTDTGENSGFISIRGSSATCSGTVLANDIVLTAANCFSSAEVIHPELLGWFMGKQDSDRNPVREILVHPSLNVAVLRLSKPLFLDGSTTGYERPLDRRNIELLPPDVLTCWGYGASTVTDYAWDTYLTKAWYGVVSPFLSWLNVIPTGPWLVANFDMGGGCLSTTSGAVTAVTGDPTAMPVSATAVRTFVAEFRAWSELVLDGTSQCLDLGAPTPSEGVRVRPVACSHVDGQRWGLRPVQLGGIAGPLYEVRAKNSNQCLTLSLDGVTMIESECGGPLVIMPSTSRRNQQLWHLLYAGNGRFQLQNFSTSDCMVLSSDGVTFTHEACDTTHAGQAFRIFNVFDGPANHRLRSQAGLYGDKCADVLGGGGAGTAAVGQWTCSGADFDQWRLDAVDGDRHVLRSRNSGFASVMEVSGGSTSWGQAVVQSTPPGAPAAFDKWRFEWRLGGYALRAVHSDQCLTMPFLSPVDGVGAQQQTCADSVVGTAMATQVWIVD